MKVQKTIKIPVSDRITKEKLKKLDRLTACLTYGCQLFKNKIIENDITTVRDTEKFRKEIQQLTVYNQPLLRHAGTKLCGCTNLTKSYTEIGRKKSRNWRKPSRIVKIKINTNARS